MYDGISIGVAIRMTSRNMSRYFVVTTTASRGCRRRFRRMWRGREDNHARSRVCRERRFFLLLRVLSRKSSSSASLEWESLDRKATRSSSDVRGLIVCVSQMYGAWQHEGELNQWTEKDGLKRT